MEDNERFPSAEVVLPECRNCEEPICRAACPADAVYKDHETGFVEHDEERCIHCNMCVMVCPFGAVKHTGCPDSDEPEANKSGSGALSLYTDNYQKQRSKRRALAFRLCLEKNRP